MECGGAATPLCGKAGGHGGYSQFDDVHSLSQRSARSQSGVASATALHSATKRFIAPVSSHFPGRSATLESSPRCSRSIFLPKFLCHKNSSSHRGLRRVRTILTVFLVADRAFQVLLAISFAAFSWLGFMVVHESGHILVGWVSGASLAHVTLHPLQVSWSAFVPNPHPQAVAWGGPVLGSLLPLALLAIARAFRAPGSYLFQFFAGFCLVANGAYMLIDTFERAGDAATLIREGAASWQIIMFGLVAAPLGFWCWHRLGHHFGLGAARGRVSRSAAIISASLLVITIAAELLLYQP